MKKTLARYKKKVDRLVLAMDRYNGGKKPIMTDAEYDRDHAATLSGLKRCLKKAKKASTKAAINEMLAKLNRTGGKPVTKAAAREEVELPIFLHSLDKHKIGDTKGMTKLLTAFGNFILVTPKIDGVSMLLHYRKGKLITGYSRGDGSMGQKLTKLALAMAKAGVVPRKLSGVESLFGTRAKDFFVRVEVVMKKSVFKAKWKGKTTAHSDTKLKNIRNAISGVVNAYKAEIDPKFVKDMVVIAIHAYDSMGNDFGVSKSKKGSSFKLKSEAMRSLNRLGFTTLVPASYAKDDKSPFKETTRLLSSPPPHKVDQPLNQKVVQAILDKSFASLSGLDFECDGLVIETDNILKREKLGWTGNDRPKFSKAYKKDAKGDIDNAKWTPVKKVEWNVAKTGANKPLVRFSPVTLNGAKLSAATGNSAFGSGNPAVVAIEPWKIGVGTKVAIVRAGDVIPQIVAVKPGTEYKGKKLLPTKCSACGSKLKRVGPDLYCSVPKVCPGVAPAMMTDSIKRLGVEGIAFGKVQKLYDGGFIDLHKIACASPQKMAAVPGMGIPTSKRLIDELRSALHKANLTKLMEASGAFVEPGFALGGSRLIKLVSKVGEKKLAALPSQETVKRLLSTNDVTGSTAETFHRCWPRFVRWMEKTKKVPKVITKETSRKTLYD